MKVRKKTSMLLQFAVIVLLSVAAAYAFQYTETTYQINGICFYRYLVYVITMFLGYVSFSYYKNYIGLAFFFVLSAVALSPLGQNVIEFFPSLVPFLAVLMGITTVLIVPSSRGRGFFEFLVVLILPAILAESRIGGSLGLLATAKSISYYELSAITASVVGGYFYLRYAVLANLSNLELLSSGGNEKDVAKVSKQSNTITILTVFGASGIAVFLMVTAPAIADVLRATVFALPLYVLTLATGAGIVITTIFYILRFSHEENVRARAR